MKLSDFDFRIWNKKLNIYVSVTYQFEEGKASFVPREEGGVFECIELWSGFCDKNGKKIYEGDIIKQEGFTKPQVVVYEKSTFYIVDISIEKDLQVDCGTRLQGIYDNRYNGYKDSMLKCLEVLGNIHENEKLLVGDVE